MGEEASLEFRLRKIDVTINYLLEETKNNEKYEKYKKIKSLKSIKRQVRI